MIMGIRSQDRTLGSYGHNQNYQSTNERNYLPPSSFVREIDVYTGSKF